MIEYDFICFFLFFPTVKVLRSQLQLLVVPEGAEGVDLCVSHLRVHHWHYHDVISHWKVSKKLSTEIIHQIEKGMSSGQLHLRHILLLGGPMNSHNNSFLPKKYILTKIRLIRHFLSYLNIIQFDYVQLWWYFKIIWHF